MANKRKYQKSEEQLQSEKLRKRLKTVRKKVLGMHKDFGMRAYLLLSLEEVHWRYNSEKGKSWPPSDNNLVRKDHIKQRKTKKITQQKIEPKAIDEDTTLEKIYLSGHQSPTSNASGPTHQAQDAVNNPTTSEGKIDSLQKPPIFEKSPTTTRQPEWAQL